MRGWATAERLREQGINAYGFDLVDNLKFWREPQRSVRRFVVAPPVGPVLLFAGGAFDLVYSFGVISLLPLATARE